MTPLDMAKDWYDGRMDEDWEVPEPTVRRALLERQGFVGEFWARG